MSISPEVLRLIHRLHQQLKELRDRLERGPKQINAKQANLDRLTNVLENVHEASKKARMTADQKELQLKTSEAKIAEVQVKLNGCKTNREYQALTDQIAADNMACSVLQDEILEAMEKADQEKTKITPAEEELEKAKADLKKTTEFVATQKTSIENDIIRLEKELTEAEERLDPETKAGYDRVVERHGSGALASVEEMACTSCYQQITVNMFSFLSMSKEAVFCKSCGCLLYLPEKTSVAAK